MAARGSLAERAALSGQDLSLLSVQFGRRKGAPPMMCLTDRDLRLVALLLDVNYLLTSQLVMLGWGSSRTRAAQRRLKVLHDGGFLDRFRPVRRIGSAEWIYRLSARGWKALASQDIVDGNARYKPAAFTSISYTEHDLQLSALILRIALDAGGSSTDGLIDTMPFTRQGPRSGRIPWRGPRRRRIDRDWHDDFDLDGHDELDWDAHDELDLDGHEKVERSPAAQLPPDTRLYPCQSRSGYLEPDATLIGGSGENRCAVVIEYDRTDRPHKQIDRLRRYDWWLLEGWRETHFATHSMPPAVVFVTSRERPLRRLVETADQVLSACYGRGDAGPREGTHPAREQILFTSRERIRAQGLDHGADAEPAPGAARSAGRVLAALGRLRHAVDVRESLTPSERFRPHSRRPRRAMSAASPRLDPGDQSATRHPVLGSPSDRLALSAIEAALAAARELGEDRPALEIVAGSLADMGVRATSTARSSRLLVSDGDAWLLRLRSAGRSTSAISAYRCAIDDLLCWADRRGRAAELFEERAIVDYLDEYRQRCAPAPATYHRRFLLLRCFMRWVSHRNGLPDPFLELQAPPKPRGESDWLTREEFVKMLHAAGHPPRRRPGLAERDQLVLLTLAMTGLRRSELIALDWGDVTLDGPRPSLLVRRGKGGKPRRQPLPTQLLGRLERLRDERYASPSDPVFCGLHGARLQPAILADIIRRASTRAGITKHVTAHTLRHTAATWLRQATGDARLVAEYLGHSDLSTVSRYAHVASEELHAATQALADGPSEDRSPSSPRTPSGASGRHLGIHPEQLAAWE